MAEPTTIRKSLEPILGKASFDSPSILHWFSTGSPLFDLSIRKGRNPSGFPGGKWIDLYGPESCLTGDTAIQFQVHVRGRRANHKGGTLERLFERFHGARVAADQRGRNRNSQVDYSEATFTAPCVNEEGGIFHNRIVDVVATGEQQCYEVKTESGLKIKATALHNFYVGDVYLPLWALQPGMEVAVHKNTPFKKDPDPRIFRQYLFVKQHPVAGEKKIYCPKVGKTYTYKRLLKSRAVIEAQLNDMSLHDYLIILNSSVDLSRYNFLSREDHVHHVDEDPNNNELSNLCVISASEHGRHHALERHNNLRFRVTLEKITSITHIGLQQTYDIKMAQPFNNYVASKFVVHNSGKTAIAARAGAEVQKAGGRVVWLDPEHGTFDEHLIRAGMDVSDEDTFIIAHPFSLESCCAAIEHVAKEFADGRPTLIVIDSLSALGVADYSMDESATKDTPPSAAAAKKLHEWWRRGILYYMSHQPIYGIMIRHQTGSPAPVFRGGGGDHVTHGKSLHYYAWLRIKMKREDLTAGQGGKLMGSWLTAKVIKSKVGPIHGECSFPYYYDAGFDVGLEQICYLTDMGILKTGKKSDGSSTGRIEYQGKNYLIRDLRENYRENNNFRENIDRMVLETYHANL